MRVLSLGLDNLVLDQYSPVAERVLEYGNLVEKYIVVVPDAKKITVDLSKQASAYGTGGSNKAVRFFKACKLSRKLFKQFDFNVVTVQDQYFLALMGWRLARKFKVGLEIQIHGFESFTGVRKIIARFVIPRAQAIRVVSERLKKRLIEEFGIKADKITVVPIFVDYEVRIIDREKEDKEKFVFLTVGRLVEIKNVDLQIEAFKNLKKQLEKIELWIVGKGSEKEKLKQLATGIQGIKFFDWQDDLSKFYKSANVYLLTSNYEGWGMVIIEAASYGLPIIMTDVGCAGEVIKDNASGLAIPVGDQAKLEEAMSRLIEDKNLRTKLSQGAQAAVLKLPTKEETLALYKKSWDLAHNAQRIMRNA